jgi:hypothetical protein
LVKGKFPVLKLKTPVFGLKVLFNQDFASCQTNENPSDPEGLKNAAPKAKQSG